MEEVTLTFASQMLMILKRGFMKVIIVITNQFVWFGQKHNSIRYFTTFQIVVFYSSGCKQLKTLLTKISPLK